MEVDDLRLFVGVADGVGSSRLAATLGVSETAIRKRLRRLAGPGGPGWLHQHLNRYRPTPKGLAILGPVCRALAASEAVASRLGVDRVSLRHVELVTTVATIESISGAARHLGMPQPAVSAQIARIERRWGSVLFDRASAGVRPRPALLAVLPDLRRLVRMVADLREAESVDGAPIPSGVRIVGEFAFTGLLETLRTEGFTDVQQHIAEIPGPGWTRGMITADVCFYADLPFVGLTVPPEHETTVAFDDPAYVLMHSGLFPDRTVVGLTELADHDWITGPVGTRNHRSVLALCQAAGFEPRIRFTAANGQTAGRIIESEVAVALTGAALVPGHGLRTIRLAEDLRVRMTVGWRRGGTAAGTARSIARWLRDAQVTRLAQLRPDLLAEMRTETERWPLYAEAA